MSLSYTPGTRYINPHTMTALTDTIIDALYGDSPFIARRKLDKSAYEVVQQTNADWRECVGDSTDFKHHGTFATHNEAATVARRLHARWVLSGSTVESSEKDARIVEVAPKTYDLMVSAINLLRQATVASGVCCCGEAMDTHTSPYMCGHTAVDSGEHYACNWLDEARAVLVKTDGVSPTEEQPK